MTPPKPPQALPTSPLEVQRWLPHRPPMLLVERVMELTENRLVATRTFAADEYFFQGHFPPPEGPILPGVILLEALAQAAALHTGLSKNLDATHAGYRFSRAHEVSWKAPVLPGQTVTLEVTKLREKLMFLEFAAVAKVGERMACEARFTAKVIEKLAATEAPSA